MIIDSSTIIENKTIKTDVCIVGAGVAGITLAKEFIHTNLNVGLFECGGLRPDNATQALFWGENVGHSYYPMDMARSCGFGGSAHRWHTNLLNGSFGPRLHPLESLDFKKRDWVPNSGWPFEKSQLDPFYERAQHFFKVGPFAYAAEDWENPKTTPRLPIDSSRVETTIFQFASREVLINDYRLEIDRAENVTLYSFANVVEIETDEAAKTVTGLQVACLDKKRFRVSAKWYILAMGAIETPRLLLLSNQRCKKGLGNQNDLVGRYFMEHPHLWSGLLIPSSSKILKSTGLYRLHHADGNTILGKLTLNEKVKQKEKLLNHCVSIHPHIVSDRPNIASEWPIVNWPVMRSCSLDKKQPNSNPVISFLKTPYHMMKKGVRKFKRPKVLFRLNHMTEQIPSSHSRVTLIDEKDIFGKNRIQLNWRFTDQDIQSIIRSQELLDEELKKAGLGKLQIDRDVEKVSNGIHGGWHHMGTTRMHVDNKRGVVDENGRVHGINNLFIAGPSVFPTGGYANPLLTIVALAIRCADHIKKQLERFGK